MKPRDYIHLDDFVDELVRMRAEVTALRQQKNMMIHALAWRQIETEAPLDIPRRAPWQLFDAVLNRDIIIDPRPGTLGVYLPFEPKSKRLSFELLTKSNFEILKAKIDDQYRGT